MTTIPRLSPAAARHTVPAIRSGARFRVRYGLSLDALTGQAATLTRASTSTVLDSTGASVAVGYGVPRHEVRPWYSGTAAGVRFGTDDCTYPLDWRPEAGTLYVAGRNTGVAQGSGGLVYLGRNDATGARLWVAGTSGSLAVTLDNGTTTSTATLGASVASGDQLELAVQLDDNGTNQRVRIGGRVNGAPVAWSAWGSSIARAATWGSGALFRVNRIGSSGTQGDVWLKELAWEPGLWDVHELEARL